jgi:hypothetical protein
MSFTFYSRYGSALSFGVLCVRNTIYREGERGRERKKKEKEIEKTSTLKKLLQNTFCLIN